MNTYQKGPFAWSRVSGKIVDCIWGRKGRSPALLSRGAAPRHHGLRSPFLTDLAPLFAALLLAVVSTAHAAPVDYRFDPVHSKLLFFADHMGFSTAIGRFARWQGEFTYDPDDASANHVDVSIDIGSLDLGDANWNKTMLSRKWFDVEHHPQARFVGTRFELIDASHARLAGELTLLGHTRPQVLDVHINRIGTHPYTLKATAGFSATTTISRSEYGLDALDGTLADAVELRIEVEGQRAEPLARKPGKR